MIRHWSVRLSYLEGPPRCGRHPRRANMVVGIGTESIKQAIEQAEQLIPEGASDPRVWAAQDRGEIDLIYDQAISTRKENDMITCDRCGTDLLCPPENSTHHVRMSIRPSSTDDRHDSVPRVKSAQLCEGCAGEIHNDIMQAIDDCLHGKAACKQKPAGTTLGQQVRDRISGFEGTVTAITTILHAGTECHIVASGDGSGRTYGGQWFNKGRLEVVGE